MCDMKSSPLKFYFQILLAGSSSFCVSESSRKGRDQFREGLNLWKGWGGIICVGPWFWVHERVLDLLIGDDSKLEETEEGRRVLLVDWGGGWSLESWEELEFEIVEVWRCWSAAEREEKIVRVKRDLEAEGGASTKCTFEKMCAQCVLIKSRYDVLDSSTDVSCFLNAKWQRPILS